MLKRNKFMQRMKRISKMTLYLQPENRAVHDKLTFGMILAAAVPRKRKVNNKNKKHEKLSNYVVAVLCVGSLAFQPVLS